MAVINTLIMESKCIWSEDYEVITTLTTNLSHKSRKDYYILNAFQTVSLGNITKVSRKDGKFMATKNHVILLKSIFYNILLIFYNIFL